MRSQFFSRKSAVLLAASAVTWASAAGAAPLPSFNNGRALASDPAIAAAELAPEFGRQVVDNSRGNTSGSKIIVSPTSDNVAAITISSAPERFVAPARYRQRRSDMY